VETRLGFVCCFSSGEANRRMGTSKVLQMKVAVSASRYLFPSQRSYIRLSFSWVASGGQKENTCAEEGNRLFLYVLPLRVPKLIYFSPRSSVRQRTDGAMTDTARRRTRKPRYLPIRSRNAIPCEILQRCSVVAPEKRPGRESDGSCIDLELQIQYY
jgi:hypothetical protein